MQVLSDLYTTLSTGTVIWGNTGWVINFKNSSQRFLAIFFFIKRSMNCGTFYINAIFGGFDMGSIGFFLK